MALKLTARQQQILDLIRATIAQTGFPPTRAEIAQTLGFRSANAAEDHLRALARKGAITLTAGASRGIRLNTPDTRLEPHSTASHDMHPVRAALSALVLPLVGRVAAGHPILATEHIDREITVDPGLFNQTPDYLLKVRGLSMRDAGILEGDLLAVKRSSEARNGQIIVARIDDEVTVKRLHRTSTQIELLPENPDFEPIIITAGSDDGRASPAFSIEGIAVGLIRT